MSLSSDFAVTADVALLTHRAGRLHIALVQRANEPFSGWWALPGGFVEVDEDLPEAAARELAEETSLAIKPSSLAQLGAYGTPGRDPRGRVVSIVYWAVLSDLADPVGGSDAAACSFLAVDDIVSGLVSLAFDHGTILDDTLERARKEGVL